MSKHALALQPGKRIHLDSWPTRLDAAPSDVRAQTQLAENVQRMQEHQKRLAATNRCAVLMIFQGMDASGKDGAIAHVMAGVKPQNCRVTSFKKPTADELRHDFLWRATCALPERGTFGLFNRSYYEDVLVPRVHPELVAPDGSGKSFWRKRYESILNFEQHLHRNGTCLIKLFLHVSKAEQRARFLARLDDHEKQWKIEAADVAERRYWNDYMSAYEDCFKATGSKHAPWHIVPADDKPSARLTVSNIILNVLDGLDTNIAAPDGERRRELAQIRRQLG